MRALLIPSLLAVAVVLGGCDPNQVGNQAQSAARGTRDAVKSTKTGIDDSQKKAVEMADEISGGKKPAAPKPADDGRPKPTPTVPPASNP